MTTDDFPFEEHLRFAPDDDGLHTPGDERNWTETAFYAFNVPERALGGWIYAQVRPNIGTVAGGAFVFDPSGWLPWEAQYYAFFHHEQMPKPLDLRDASLPTGVSMQCLEPCMRYRIGYALADRDEFRADLEFAGTTPPVPHVSGEPPFATSSHFDQHGRVTGTISLRGEEITVDCLAVRDRSWGPRPELRPRDLQMSYCYAAVSPGDGFLAFTMPAPTDPTSETEQLFAGYLLRDGVVRRLQELSRRNVRDRASGAVAEIEVEGADTDGRRVHAHGVARSRTPLLLAREVAMISLLEWSVDGAGATESAWGEDQSVYPFEIVRQRRR